MQIPKINLTQNQNNKQNFNGIKSIKVKGLYKEKPQLAKELILTFMENPTAMNFAKTKDLDIWIQANEHPTKENTVISKILIDYYPLGTSKLKKFLLDIINNDTIIKLSRTKTDKNSETAFIKSHTELRNQISSNPTRKIQTLNSYIENITQKPKTKAAAKQQKAQEILQAKIARKQLQNDQKELEQTIQKAIFNTSTK